MTCEEMEERMSDWLAGTLDDATLAELRDHLATCDGCAADARAFERLWSELEAAPAETPSAEMRQRFDDLLRGEIDRQRSNVVDLHARRSAGRTPFAATPLLRWAAIAAMLVVAVFAGSELSRRRDARAIADLQHEVHSLHESVALALLAQSSPSERLKGVSYGRGLSAQDDRVAAALFQAMLKDPDVNVRLAALDALKPVAARPETATRLAAAIAGEDSPLMQLSLIDVLLDSDGAAARRDLEQLLDNPKLDPVVRGYLADRLGRSV